MAVPSRGEECELLNEVIDATPIIDNHAHPLLKLECMDAYPLMSIATEATGDALKDTWSSLAFIRAVKQLSVFLGCAETWEAVEDAIKKKRADGHDAWIRRCFQGIETILVDDGLGNPAQVESYSWHDAFTTSKCKRIVRIETVAQDIIARHCANFDPADDHVNDVANEALADIQQAFQASYQDSEVVGFKSVVCYRVGLDITPEFNQEEGRKVLQEIVGAHVAGTRNFVQNKRIEHRALNHCLVHMIARVIKNSPFINFKKPLQFHTGLGDNDITLTRSSPSHLQDFIRQYPVVPIVILHASYPWTRDAGYLAAMYSNVYADIGEVFPFINRQGQESIIKQILELCPWSKILWSTDGHFFPETYLLATTQIRSVLKTVLGELVQTRQINEKQAIRLVQDILFNNSKKLYTLDVVSKMPDFPTIQNLSLQLAPETALSKLRAMSPKFLRIYWHDYTSTARCRLIPIKRVYKALEAGEHLTLSLTKATLGLLQIDTMIPEINASGTYMIKPDWSTMRKGPADGHVSCYGEFKEEDGSGCVLCPRTILRRTLEKAMAHDLSFLMGFEIEFVLLGRNPDSRALEKYRTLPNDGHSWSRASALADWGGDEGVGTAIEEMLDALEEAGIPYEQFHPENAPGQYELVLPALPPLKACDTLLHARQILESAAARTGLRMTLHPKPFTSACGTASHAHISVSSSSSKSDDDASVYEPFYAGILRHLPALAAFTCSNPTSYERQGVDSVFAGGRYVTWGTQNKEAPLRKCSGSHWEIKMLDGLANPYFAAAGFIAAGTQGIVDDLPLELGDCQEDPAKIGPEGRQKLGIDTVLPADLPGALQELQKDTELATLLGPEFVQRFVDVKHAELELIGPMGGEERRQWIIERY